MIRENQEERRNGPNPPPQSAVKVSIDVDESQDDDVDVMLSESDLYGQCHPIETTALINSKLKRFRRELSQEFQKKNSNHLRRHDDVSAAQIAWERYPHLYATDEFVLWFLRCEVYDVALAVQRYIRYWKKRVELFGGTTTTTTMPGEEMEEKDVAYQPMTLSHMSILQQQDDQSALNNEFIQVVLIDDPERRSYAFINPSKQDKTQYSREAMTRVLWYKIHAILQDDELVQKRGLIILAYPHHAKFSQFDKRLAKSILSSMVGCLPVRLSAFHVCHPPSFFRIVYGFMQLFLSHRLKQRIHIHYYHPQNENQQQEQQSLSSQDSNKESSIVQMFASRFDIPKDHLPTELGGDLELDQNAWLQHRSLHGK